MPFSFPGALLNWIPGQFLDLAGAPLANGKVQFYVTGTVTPKNTYTAADRATANANPVILDADGRATIFLTSGGYDAVVMDEDDVELYTVEGFEDIGLTFLESLGNVLAEGDTDVTTGYTVLSTDNFVTVDSSSGATVVNLPTAASRSSTSNGNGLPLVIKNMDVNTVSITPNGADTIDNQAGAYTLPAAASPLFPSVTLYSDGVSNWWIPSSHGVA